MSRALRSVIRVSIFLRTRGALLMLSFAAVVAAGAVLPGHANAQTSYSTDYSVTEAQFGSGSLLEGCSDEYCAQATLGDLTVGRGSSENYSAQFGFNTSNEPMLQVITEATDQHLGVLETESTATHQATIKVRTYLSDGYVMQIVGNTPHMGSRYLVPLLGAEVSTPGTEQFGINLVNNSSPDIGADPVATPEGVVNTAVVTDGYDIPNSFKYLNGDVVVQNPYGSGETQYTLSMIVNISNTTPGGYYVGNFSAVVTPTY